MDTTLTFLCPLPVDGYPTSKDKLSSTGFVTRIHTHTHYPITSRAIYIARAVKTLQPKYILLLKTVHFVSILVKAVSRIENCFSIRTRMLSYFIEHRFSSTTVATKEAPESSLNTCLTRVTWVRWPETISNEQLASQMHWNRRSARWIRPVRLRTKTH